MFLTTAGEGIQLQMEESSLGRAVFCDQMSSYRSSAIFCSCSCDSMVIWPCGRDLGSFFATILIFFLSGLPPATSDRVWLLPTTEEWRCGCCPPQRNGGVVVAHYRGMEVWLLPTTEE